MIKWAKFLFSLPFVNLSFLAVSFLYFILSFLIFPELLYVGWLVFLYLGIACLLINVICLGFSKRKLLNLSLCTLFTFSALYWCKYSANRAIEDLAFDIEFGFERVVYPWEFWEQEGPITYEKVNFTFRGFPHQGRVLEYSYFEEADPIAAKAWYENQFLGKKAAQLIAAFEEDKNWSQEKKLRHHASMLKLNPTVISERETEYEVIYAFSMRDPVTRRFGQYFIYQIFFQAKDEMITSVRVVTAFRNQSGSAVTCPCDPKNL